MKQEQIVLTGRIKDAKYTEIITFALDLAKLDWSAVKDLNMTVEELLKEVMAQRLVFIVNVPEEGRSRAPVYIKQVTHERVD